MKIIFKYPLDPTGGAIEMPVGAQVLTAREQWENICIWALVDMEQRGKEMRTFQVYGTGHAIPDDPTLVYIGTAMLCGDALVWHVFESRPR